VVHLADAGLCIRSRRMPHQAKLPNFKGKKNGLRSRFSHIPYRLRIFHPLCGRVSVRLGLAGRGGKIRAPSGARSMSFCWMTTIKKLLNWRCIFLAQGGAGVARPLDQGDADDCRAYTKTAGRVGPPKRAGPAA
jgi:hypothetical protein